MIKLSIVVKHINGVVQYCCCINGVVAKVYVNKSHKRDGLEAAERWIQKRLATNPVTFQYDHVI
jgi:hypothetical protein